MNFSVTPVNKELALSNPDDVVLNIKRKLKGLGIGFVDIKQPIEGPMVTGYPIILDSSTPLNKLLNKSEDLALACGVESVHIQRIGREVIIFVPNKEKKVVQFNDALYWFLQDEKVREMSIPLLLGTDTNGDNVAIELTKQPHILISGSTGSGKSIFEANLIASLAMLKSTNELEMYLVDTKMLDLPLFAKVPHVQEVCRNVEDYYSMITMLNGEVEKRNKKMANAGVRNIKEYNSQHPDKKMPFILLLIDELADLIDKDKYVREMNGKLHTEQKVLDSLRRLLQICRAAGVHVIACTQRTSADIVSGIVKTNFPARIALKLPTKKDSEYILDEGGAENLLGNGDMLVKETDSDLPKRYHSPFVRLEDVRACLEGMEMIKQTLQLEM